MNKVTVIALFCIVTTVSTGWAQTASDAAAQGGSTDAIVQMRMHIAAANKVYDRKVAAAKKVFDEKKAAAAKERDAAIAAARSGTTQ
ncbi:hypothetical protein P3T23_008930 [Paraburkholderia sp. GAS448]|uniref:hypothetical protein n=1 Tax=Paraburkholderia sp. GAS448 TaxID=3035136 RepID=UPI003D23B2C0